MSQEEIRALLDNVAAGVTDMSMEEIDAEIAAYRKEKRQQGSR